MDIIRLRGENVMKAIRQHPDGLLATSRNRRWVILWLAVLLSFAVPWVSRAIAAPSCPDPGGCWATKADMPTARVYLAVGVVNNKLYAIGGYNPGFLTTVEEYDPAADQWTTKTSMPTARYGMAVSVVNNKIYAIGGTTNVGTCCLTTVEEYDPVTNTWTNCGTPAPGNDCTPMPTGRSHLAIGVVNNKIYAIGGCGNSGCSSIFATAEEYDPATNTWATKAPMLAPRYNLAAGMVNNKIYAIGGNDGSYSNEVEEYDPATDTWTNCGTPAPGNDCTPMPTARGYLAVGVVNNKIRVTGGTNGSSYFNTVEEYDPATDTWTNCGTPAPGNDCTPMPTGREGLAAGVVNNTIYAIGGFNGSYLNTVEEGTIPLPFAAFDAQVEIELGPLANDDEFEVKGTFTLGAESNGINPLTEIVALQLTGGSVSFSSTIPAGSFQFVPAKLGKKPKPAHFKFEGVIDGVSLEAKITPLGADSFEFKAEAEGADLTGIANPVTVILTVGDDGDNTTVEAEFE